MKAVKKKLWTGWIRIQKILTEKDGISTVELILVLVVIIVLVIIFKKQLNELVTKIFEKITNEKIKETAHTVRLFQFQPFEGELPENPANPAARTRQYHSQR